MRFRAFLVWLVVLVGIVGIALAAGAGDALHGAIEARRLEAQAQRDAAQAQLLAERNERLVLRPLATAATVDTGMSVVYAIADRVLLLAVIAYLVWRERHGTQER